MPPTIGELVDLADVETVVRLDGPGGLLAELVRTGDVSVALEQVTKAATGPAGQAFFVVGPFGSGKSHLLSAVGELLEAPPAPARRSLAVRVPLVDYRAEMALEDVTRQRAEAGPGGPDRREHWDGVLEAARRSGYDGLVVLLDEVSEWLRAKRGAALTEDLRFLQFLGEWAKDRPVVVLAALQESLEEVANVSEKELARIRDRYRDLRLSMRHVEDLVRGRLVRLRPGAEAWVEKVGKEIARSFPGARFDAERLARCYPLHPSTLDLLQGLGFLLSQNRGVVDFVCRQVRADLAAPGTGLVTPERIWDHFSGRLAEWRGTARLAGAVVPYWQRAVLEVFAEPGDRDLALRAVKLLSLISASPLERPPSAAELAGMLLAKVSDADPAANVSYLEQVILAPVVARGAYVVADAGKYSVETGADAAVALEGRLTAARAELNEADRRMVATLVDLGSSSHLPFGLMKATGPSKRQLLWQNTERHLVVSLARAAEWTPEDVAQAAENARKSGAEGALVVSEPELSASAAAELSERAQRLAACSPRVAFWAPAAPTEAELASLADLHARRVVREHATSEGRDDLVALLDRARDAEAARGREILARLYFSGAIVTREGTGGPDLPSLSGLSFESQLPRLAAPLLAGLHPLHSRVAPRGELVGLRHVHTLVNEVIAPGHVGPAGLERGGLRALVEGYLAPLGIAHALKGGATVAPDAARSPAVAEVLRLVGENGPVPGPRLVETLAEGPLGLTEPETLLLLNACARAGLIERWRGKKKMAETFFAVTGTDSFGTGELVDQPLREAVASLPAAIVGAGPFEPWTSSTQREAWEKAQSWLQARREDVAQVRSGLRGLDDFPALSGAQTSRANEDLRLLEGLLQACGAAASPAEGLRALVEWERGGSGDLVGAARRSGALARFFRDDVRRVADEASYATHPELLVPEADDGLAGLRAAVTTLLPEVLVLAAEDRLSLLTDAMRELRSAYTAAYQEAHDRHYAAVSPAEVEALRETPAYRALSALSGTGSVPVPDDRVKVDRMIASAVPPPCRRRVEHELAWKPRCGCGFTLGDPLPELDAGAVLEVAERGLSQQLGELSEASSRLAGAADHLDALGRGELANDLRQLLEVAARPGEADPVAVAALASSGELQQVLREVLSGGQLIVTRDLAVLREDLIGRRYPKRRLLDLLAAWVDPEGSLPPGGFVEVVDGSEPAPHDPAAPRSARLTSSPTAELLRARFPSLAAALPEEGPADAFWLAAWWAGRPGAPRWLPSGLAADPRLAQAAEVARSDLGALGELADLDSRCGPGTALGEQVSRSLALGSSTVMELAGLVESERLLRYPLSLAADGIVRRLAGDWQVAARVAEQLELATVSARHFLLAPEELVAFEHVLDAACHIAQVERLLPDASCAELVEALYPEHLAPVPNLLSRASMAAAGRSVVSHEAVLVFSSGARRVLEAPGMAFARHAEAGFPGCLAISDVGRKVVGPLLESGGKVAVVLVDAMRADAARLLAGELSRALPGRRLSWHWAVVPSPTRTAEAVAALALGRPVPGGSAGPHGASGTAGSLLPAGSPPGPAGGAGGRHGPALAPFEHLGYEVALLKQADRDHNAVQLKELWASRSPVMVAIASSLDERLHHSSVELATLLDDATRTISQRVFASLSALPASVPVVLLADHGFRENPHWGKGPEGRYVHGGTSLEECVIPVVVAS
jgi:hypothetical protein